MKPGDKCGESLTIAALEAHDQCGKAWLSALEGLAISVGRPGDQCGKAW